MQQFAIPISAGPVKPRIAQCAIMSCVGIGHRPASLLTIELTFDLACRLSIPEPLGRKKFSGKFVVRAPEELHATLAQEALRRGKSMNELAVELLSKVRKKGA